MARFQLVWMVMVLSVVGARADALTPEAHNDATPATSVPGSDLVSPPPRILVPPITDNAGAGDEAIEAWTSTLAGELSRSTRFRVLTQADLRTLVAAEQLAQMLGCGEGTCITDLAQASGADYLLTGQLGLVGEARVMTVALLEAHQGTPIARATRTIPPSQEKLALARLADELMARAAGEPLGELALTTEPAGALVMVEGLEFGSTPLPATTLRPGTWRVVLQKEGFRVVETTLTVTAGPLTQQTFVLEPIEEQMKASDVAKVASDAAAAGAEAARLAAESSVEEARQEAARARADFEAREAAARREADEAARRLEKLSQKRLEEAEARLLAAAEPPRRRRQGGVAVKASRPLFDDTVAQARQTVTDDAASYVVGLSGKLPLLWRLFGGIRVEAMPTFPAASPSDGGAVTSSGTVPAGFLEAGAGLGIHVPLPGPLFLEVAVDAGARMTRSVRSLQSDGQHFEEADWATVPITAGRATIGVGLGALELAVTASMSQPLDLEQAEPAVGDGVSIAGFGRIAQVGAQLGLSF